MSGAVTKAYRLGRRFLRSPIRRSPDYPALRSSYGAARNVVAIYYIASVIVVVNLMMQINPTVANVTAWDFLWPLYWVDPANAVLTLKVLGALCFGASLIACLWHRVRAVRILFSVLFLMACTVPNSFSGINHPYHAWFWVSFLLIFLPSGSGGEPENPSRRHMMAFATSVFTVQMTLFLFYSMSGVWKVFYGIRAVVKGQDGAFSLGGLAYNLADRVLQTNTSPLLVDFVIENYLLAWIGFLGVMYVQATALIAAFRPRLHVLWGALIVLFHLGTWLLMEIIFNFHVLLLAIFFLYSPFRPARFNLRDTLADVPFLGTLFPSFFGPAPDTAGQSAKA